MDAAEPSKQLKQCPVLAELKSFFFVVQRRRIKLFAYGFMVAFVACTAFIAFSPNGSTSPWYNRIIFSGPSARASYGSQISSFFSFIFPDDGNASSARPLGDPVIPVRGRHGVNGSSSYVAAPKEQKEIDAAVSVNVSVSNAMSNEKSNSNSSVPSPKKEAMAAAGSFSSSSTSAGSKGGSDFKKDSKNHAESSSFYAPKKDEAAANRSSQFSSSLPGKKVVSESRSTNPGNSYGNRNVSTSSFHSSMNKDDFPTKEMPKKASSSAKFPKDDSKGISAEKGVAKNSSVHENVTSPDRNGSGLVSETRKGAIPDQSKDQRTGEMNTVDLERCNIFEGRWVRDDSYPLYREGSCPHIDEPFNCFLNGRPDRKYQSLRWQPDSCKIPRLNASDMLERLRGKRLVFVGDSLNRNMWESLVCVLRNSVQDKSKVFEASGRLEFRTEGSYSFVFKDYNCSVEFFRSPFLVQEWEIPEPNGTSKETLRLDVIERSSSKYKNADVIIFNTGHWWTHEKTSKGKDYYQEGSHIYGNLNVGEAFRRALTTWARWVDANIDSSKTIVFFRGYSASHFSGGRWNSGGACDKETEPIKNENYLSAYPPKMTILESVMKGMKTPVHYLNITRMTDYRKDAHPSVYRKRNLTEEERRSPERYQDCSHWCLPGVPDSWNELLYAKLIMKQERHA